MTRIAIYPGTFDPITRGHEDIIRRAGALCDLLYVAVARAHHKQTLFNIEERLAMVCTVCADIHNGCDIRPIAFEGLLVEACRQYAATIIVRGIGMNRHLLPQAETVFLITADHYSFVSSSLIRETARLGGDVGELVHASVKKNLTTKVCTQS